MYIKEYIKLRPKLKEFEFAPVKREEIYLHVQQMKSTMSVGHDQVYTHVLKKFADMIVPDLTHVVNLALISSKYPDAWKLGIISPVPKSGDLKLAKNWRPVTLLCTIPLLLAPGMLSKFVFLIKDCFDVSLMIVLPLNGKTSFVISL